jgi:tRNA threonylcarbamoyladenosine biosynthesis protein TsaB
MRILAIDTALPAVSACVFESGADEPAALESMPMTRGHAEALVPLIDRVIAASGGDFATIDRVAVTVGPGSFTGLRVGIAAARALGLACNVPVVGVSTLAAMAAPLILDGEDDTVGIAIDARHGNVFFAAFGADGRALMPPHVATIAAAAATLAGGPARVAGSGAPMIAIEAWSKGQMVEIVGEVLWPDISYVAKLGLLADPNVAPPRPLYLKAPDATPRDTAIPLSTS